MEKLDQAYKAVEMLKALDLPVSNEQIRAIAMMERQYLREEVIPKVTEEMTPLVEMMHNKFRLEVTYNHESGLDIQVVDKKPVQESLFPSMASKTSRKEKKWIIRIVYPDGHAFCSKVVWETLADVVKYAGIERVRDIGIMMFGENFVSQNPHPDERYRKAQKEVGEGYSIMTCSPTYMKYDQIKRINKELNLGLRIEKVML
ncbi:MAG: hypothetical protein J5965_23020 [Aeriscardovia sp.]|nr:hypothetical protein [Aeriscardovia sp.]